MTTCIAHPESVKYERLEGRNPPSRSHHFNLIGGFIVARLQSITECPPFPVIEGVEFRHCFNWLGYIAGSDGSIWSCRYNGSHLNQPRSWRKLTSVPDKYGYRSVCIRTNDGKRSVVKRVHTLVCEAFHGPRPEGLDCCHNDGTRDNNVPSNLRWDTVSANMRDAVRLGTYCFDQRRWHRGERHAQSLLSNADVAEIRRLAGTMLGKDIAKRFNVSPQHTYDIIKGKARKFG